MIVDHLDVSYCEGWDPHIRAAVGPLSSARAAERDRAGEQYAVLLAVSGRPLAIIEVAWGDHYCGVWFFDEQFRRVYQYDCRRLAQGGLFVARGAQWAHADAAESEFDARASGAKFEVSPDGHMEAVTWPPGDTGLITHSDDEVEPGWIDVPEFGDWGQFIRGFSVLDALGYALSPAVVIDDVSAPGGDGLPAGQRPWHPPRPLQPAHLGPLFTAGTRVVLGTGDTALVEVRPAGMLRMPSGKLIIGDPAWIDADLQYLEPFTATVRPGEYPVLLSLVYRADDPQHQRVAAAKLAVGGDPVASGEPALLAGQDPKILPDGGFFGFEAYPGTACFFDAIAAPAMAHLTGTLVLGDATNAELTDPESGANLIAFDSSWGNGSYPTWIGRTANGHVACFVADMQLLGDHAVPDQRADQPGE